MAQHVRDAATARGDARAAACATARRSCPAPGSRASRPATRSRAHVREQRGVAGHPLQGRVADHDVDVRSGAPLRDVAERHRHARRPGRAAAIISGEESMPSTTASGQRCASSAVSVAGPQPRSTTRRGRVGADPGEQIEERAGPLVGVAAVLRGSQSHVAPRYLDVKRYASRSWRDEVDEIVAAWRRERPDLDVEPLQVLSRDQPAGRGARRAPRRRVRRARAAGARVRRAVGAAAQRRAVRAHRRRAGDAAPTSRPAR